MGNSVFGPPSTSAHGHLNNNITQQQQQQRRQEEAAIAAPFPDHPLFVETERSTGGSFNRDDPFSSDEEQQQQQQQQANQHRLVPRGAAGDQLAATAEPSPRDRAVSSPVPLEACSGQLTKMSSGSLAASAASLVAAPSAAGGNGGQRSWCLVKAKTRQHNSTRVTRKAVWFEAKAGSSFSVGRAQHCDLRLDDDRCSELNATLEPARAPGGGIMLNPRARMYQLVGMGAKRSAYDTVIYVGAVLKVGSVSLEVTDMCTDESDDFVERFAVEISSARRSQARRSVDRLRGRGDTATAAAVAASAASNGGVSAVVMGAKAKSAASKPKRAAQPGSKKAAPAGTSGGGSGGSGSGGAASGSGSSNNEDGESEASMEEGNGNANGSGNGGATTEDEDEQEPLGEEGSDQESVADADEEDEDDDADDAMCYICWGGQEPAPGDEDDDGNTVPAAAAASAATGASAAHAHAHGEAGGARPALARRSMRDNPLIRNPCGKCSGSSRYVHLNCLLTWIKSSGSGHCSICNGPLPQHFSSPPPNLELKVVRHRRGQSWVGTRRFRLSFADRDVAVIGRDSESDVRLPDRSVGSTHARITFNRELRRFELADCHSLGGTFVQVKAPLELVPEQSTYLKIGRTLLSLRMTHKRGAMYMLQNPLSWTRRT